MTKKANQGVLFLGAFIFWILYSCTHRFRILPYCGNFILNSEKKRMERFQAEECLRATRKEGMMIYLIKRAPAEVSLFFYRGCPELLF